MAMGAAVGEEAFFRYSNKTFRAINAAESHPSTNEPLPKSQVMLTLRHVGWQSIHAG